jgi:molybdopterin synthase sulfur carrier subunit
VAHLHFTQNLARHTECPTAELSAATVAELFERYFETWPTVRSYVLDDQGAVRHHVKVLVDGCNLRDRKNLTDNIQKQSEVFVFQALSGG